MNGLSSGTAGALRFALTLLLVLTLASHSARAQDIGSSREELRGGSPSPDIPRTNAAVNVNGASGTLVAPDIALTNGHVVGVTVSATPPFSVTNVPYPDRWYPIPPGNQIRVTFGRLQYGRSVVDTMGRGLNSRTRMVLDDRNGGTLEDGDEIGIKTSNERYLFVRGGADGGRVEIDDLYRRYDAWQRMTIERVDGSGTVRAFDKVALRAADGSYIASRGRRRASWAQASGSIRGPEHEFTILRVGGPGPLRHGDSFGLVAPRVSGGGWMQYPFLVFARQITFPGYDDLVLLRLDTTIPRDVAEPVTVMTTPPAEEPVMSKFYRDETFSVHGFGQVDGGTAAAGRQQGQFTNARLTGPTSVYSASAVTGAGIMCGDSGSGWLWNGRLVGVTQRGGCGPGGFTGGMFISSMSAGGVDPGGLSKPDLTAWYGIHLDIDDCGPVTSWHRSSNPIYGRTGSTEVCRFGGSDPYAVALFGGSDDGADCLAIDPAALSLGRPSGTETRWLLRQGNRRHLMIPGSWQQSYTRGAYLIDFARRRNLTKMCFDRRPNPGLVYLRP